MNESFPANPYAAPKTDIVIPSSGSRAWIENESLVIPKDWRSPPICLLTGAITNLTPVRRKKLTWSNPAMILLIFLGFIGIIAMVALQKKGVIYCCFSRSAADRVRKKLLINWSVLGLGVCLLALGFTNAGETDILILPGFLLILVSAVLGVTLCRPIKTAKIDKTHIWLSGLPAELRETIVRMESGQLDRSWS